jgi:acetyltransferase-like isoleucine patch superfamily enzyme
MDEPLSQKRTFDSWNRQGDSRVPPPRNAADRLIRTFRFPAYLLSVLTLYGLGCLALGLALAPAAWVFYRLGSFGLSLSNWLRWPVVGLTAALSFFVFGFTLLIVVPILNKVLPTRIRPYKGGYFMLASVPWFVHNGLFYIVRFTFLPFVTMTPFGLWFLKGMGMKVGKRAFINTEHISDPRLITLGDDVALGGSVRIFAHYGGGGNLVIAPVVIGDRCTVGLAATIMGDVVIGSGATILPHSVLLPGSRVGEGETWGGVPARPIPREEMDQLKEVIRGAKGTG